MVAIGKGVFSERHFGGDITIPNSVTSIGEGAFFHCRYLDSIKIPDSVTYIGNWAFAHCGLSEITIPNSVTSIGEGAFAACPVSSITIPDSVTRIGEAVFVDCKNLDSFIVDENNPNYRSIDNVLFSKDKTELIFCPDGKIGTYRIPNGVISIGRSAFNSCSLTSIIISDSVKNIGSMAFAYCGIKSIIIPESVTSFEVNAFYYCPKLVGVCFMGDAPNEFSYEVMMWSDPTIYFLNNKSGWTTPEWNGRKTVGLDRFFDKGDLTGEGAINITDAQMALRYALNIIELEKWQLLAADVNDDDKVDLLDAQMILRAALNIINI